jgi:hypothetical protein
MTFQPLAADAAADGSEDEELGLHDPARLASYRRVGVVYLGAVAGVAALAKRRGLPTIPPPTDRLQELGDLALVAVSTYKMSRLLSKQRVTAPLRAPFTHDDGPAGPGEVTAQPVGEGWRRSVGELLSCPFCLDVWIATASIAGLRLAPRVARPVVVTSAAVGLADLLQFVYVQMEHRATAGAADH